MPCADCGAADWTLDMTGTHCQRCGAEREGPVQAGFSSLADMLAAERAKAESLPADIVARLPEMFAAQLAAEIALRDRIAIAFEAAAEKTAGWKADDAGWLKVNELSARAMYADLTVMMLTERHHILVCPNHGVRGVDLGQELWEPLSCRGYLEGAAMAWIRYCERCSKDGWIAAKVREMTANIRGGKR